MIEKIYLITCTHCGRDQQTIVRGNNINKKYKKCIYCNKNIPVGKSIKRMLIR